MFKRTSRDIWTAILTSVNGLGEYISHLPSLCCVCISNQSIVVQLFTRYPDLAFARKFGFEKRLQLCHIEIEVVNDLTLQFGWLGMELKEVSNETNVNAIF